MNMVTVIMNSIPEPGSTDSGYVETRREINEQHRKGRKERTKLKATNLRKHQWRNRQRPTRQTGGKEQRHSTVTKADRASTQPPDAVRLEKSHLSQSRLNCEEGVWGPNVLSTKIKFT